MASTEAAIGRDLRRLFEGSGVAGLTEAQLLDHVARHDRATEAAFEAILTRHGPAVLACCRRVLGDANAAEDAFQATFLVLFHRAGSIRVEESLAPWLLHVARMAALKARQGEIRRRVRERRSARPEAMAPEAVASDLGLLVRAEVDRLPGKYRDPVRLCYFEGRTHDDAALALGWPVGTIRGRLSRARDMLRTRLLRRGVGITPVVLAAMLAAGHDARAEVPFMLHEATLAATSRGAVLEAGVAALAAAVTRGLAVASVKTAAVLLVAVSLISAGAGMAVLGGHPGGLPREQDPPRAEAPAHARDSGVDRYGDPLPRGAIARLGTTRFRHNYWGGNWTTNQRVVYGPDSRSLVTVGAREARVWDLESERLIRTIEADDAALSPDGKTLFALKSAVNLFSGPAPGVLRSFDFSTGRELRRVGTAQDEPMKLLTVSPEGTNLAAVVVKGFENKALPSCIVIYDAVSLAERRRIEGDFQSALGLAFSTDGRMLAVAGPEGGKRQNEWQPKTSSARLYDVATGVQTRRFTSEEFGVGSVTFAPDGKTLAAGFGDRTIRLYDLATGRERLPRLGPENAIRPPNMERDATRPRAAACLAFSPDGSLLASGLGFDGHNYEQTHWPEITLWDVASAREVRRFAGHPYQVCALAFSADGKRLASAGGEPEARIWDVATGREVDHRTGHPHGIMALAVSPADGTVFTTGNDDGLVIHWDPADGHVLETLAVEPSRFHSLEVSLDGGTLLIGYTDGVIVWNVSGHEELRRIRTKGVRPVFSPDGRTFASGLSVWDVASGRRLDAFRESPRAYSWYTADGRRLISVEADAVRVWDFKAGVEVGRPLKARLNGWFNAAVSPDNRLLATGNVSKEADRSPDTQFDPAIRVWELASGKQIAKLMGHLCNSNDLVFSPDGRMVAAVSGRFRGERDAGLRVWDVATGREVRRFDYHPDGANFLVYLPDGRAIVTASGYDGMALVWDVSDLANLRERALPEAKALETLWSDLASDDAPRGFRASWALSVEGAVPFLRSRLLLAGSKEQPAGPEVLCSLRAIAALERIGSPPARDVLEKLARGNSASLTTQDSAAAILRLLRDKPRPPAVGRTAGSKRQP